MNKQQTSLLVAVVIAIIVGVVGYQVGTKGNLSGGGDKEILPGRPYQAVFLSNGQVYFGKVTRRIGEVTTLRDIYYLQVQQPIQPPPAGQTTQPQIQLVKLGSELHKPRDEMTITSDHILFIEDLQEDGQVVQAIRRFQQGERASGQPPTSSGQGQPAPTEQKTEPAPAQ